MKNNSENYADLILQHPLFCLLDSKDAHQLIGYSKAETAETGQKIVAEGNPIDCLYLITSGTAEVIRIAHTVEKKQVMRIAQISKGDIIGLSAEGFSSQTGLRTATVKALSPMSLLKINLYDFLQFLKQPHIKYPDLKKLSEEFLLIQFIRSHHLFRDFSHEKIQNMVATAQNIKIPANTDLYHQGDVADACYYLLKGEVILENLNNQSTTVVTINQMFGDAEFMRDRQRKEKAYTKQDSELLIIEEVLVKKFMTIERPSLLQKIISKFMRNHYD